MYFLVKNAAGEAISIEKKTFCWLLNDEYQKLSNDRVLRFQSSKKESNLKIPTPGQQVIKIGDWCQFKFKNQNIVGQILGFIFLNKQTKKESRYPHSFAEPSSSNVGVLASWFVKKRKTFVFKMIDDFIPINEYIDHIEKPESNLLIYK